MDNNVSFLHIISLGSEHLHAPYISDTLMRTLEEQKKQGKKSLLLYNRRGYSRAYICEECGHYEKCPHCDIAYAYHNGEKKMLLCHQCGMKAPLPFACAHCSWHTFHEVWVGIQKVEQDLIKLLPWYNIRRIDADSNEKIWVMVKKANEADIIIGTHKAIFLPLENLGTVVFLFFEVNFSIPEYDIEESMAVEVSYFRRKGIPIYIQTYMRDHPLLETLLHGNYKDVLEYIKKERKEFSYPPYAEMATIIIHHENKDKTMLMASHIIRKLSDWEGWSLQISYDRDSWSKNRAEWVQKIVLRGENISRNMAHLEVEVLRNRGVTLEWN